MSIKVWIISVIGIICLSAVSSYEKVRFSTYIVQNGKKLEINQHEIKVKRTSFKIVFDLPDAEGVFLHSSFNSTTYQQVMANVQVNSIPGFKSSAMFEMWGNPSNELLVSDDNPCYWFIESASKHRFSSYKRVNGRYICERNVDKLYDVDKHQEISLSTVEEPLYLTFIKYFPNASNSRGKEMMRHELKIVWID